MVDSHNSAIDGTVYFLCLINLLQNSSVSITAPFYPLEVKEKEIPVIYIGFLLGSFAFIYIFSAFLTGRYL